MRLKEFLVRLLKDASAKRSGHILQGSTMMNCARCGFQDASPEVLLLRDIGNQQRSSTTHSQQAASSAQVLRSCSTSCTGVSATSRLASLAHVLKTDYISSLLGQLGKVLLSHVLPIALVLRTSQAIDVQPFHTVYQGKGWCCA